ncbi:hypothetical protein KR054_002073 [Drosophila jambulina]|nr:hypothetical protein KR054_002073 [Drosophila jambulina]
MSEGKDQKPGDGIRSMRTTGVFRLINFELYAKPVRVNQSFAILEIYILYPGQNAIIMGLGLTAIAGVFGYIAYMRYKYESLGYYVAVKENGREEFIKKKSNWES